MRCRVCCSENEAEFTAEMMIHFSGFMHLANPGILMFPKISVCLDCGSSRFSIPGTELKSLRESNSPSKVKRMAAHFGIAS